MDTEGILTLIISGLALIFSVYSAFISYKTQQRQTQLSFFSEYTRRYQDIMLHLCDDNSEVYFRLYFDLCSEEFYLHEHKYLPDEVWDMWEDGMKIMAKNHSFETAWTNASQFYDSEFNRFFNKIINESKSNNYKTL
jgi:hypothetical protein